MYICKIINTFHNYYLEKFIITLLLIDSALQITKPITKPTIQLTIKSFTNAK